MNRNNITLQIPEPCSQSWNAMTDCNGGKFCTQCSNIITDFTQFTDAELLQMLAGHKGRLCGRFNNEQLNRPLGAPTHNPVARYSLPKVFAGLLLLLTAQRTVAAKPHVQKTLTAQMPVRSVAVNHQQLPGPDSITVTGTVIGAGDKQPLAGAAVAIKNKNGGVIADLKGAFKITAIAGDTLQIKYIGYNNALIPITAENAQKLEVQLTEAKTNTITTVGIVVSPYHQFPRPSTTLKNRFRMWFGLAPKYPK